MLGPAATTIKPCNPEIASSAANGVPPRDDGGNAFPCNSKPLLWTSAFAGVTDPNYGGAEVRD